MIIFFILGWVEFPYESIFVLHFKNGIKKFEMFLFFLYIKLIVFDVFVLF